MQTTTTAVAPSRRGRRLVASAALAVIGALILAGCWSADQTKDMDLINASRRANNKSVLAGDNKAMTKAQAWSAHMAATGVMEHTGGGSKLDTRGVDGWCSYYENVGYGPSVAAVHQQFLNSPAHKANMLSASHRVGTGAFTKNGTVWVTEIYLRNC